MNSNLLNRLSKIFSKPSSTPESSDSQKCDINAGKLITVKTGDLIPCDGEVVDGFATVDESAVVGVSSPAIIDATTGRNQVLANTLVIEGELKIRCAHAAANQRCK